MSFKRLKTTAAMAAVAAGALVALAGPAAATTPKACGSHLDYFLLDTSTGTVCYVDPGTITVHLTGVTYVSSGNNYGAVTFSYPGHSGVTHLPKNASWNYFNSPGVAVTVTKIQLSASPV